MIGDILQPTHLLFILVVALIVLGPKRLPEVGRSLGKGLRDFRAAVSGEELDHHEELVAPAPVAPTPVAPTPVAPARAAVAPAPVEPSPVAPLAAAPATVAQTAVDQTPPKPSEQAG